MSGKGWLRYPFAALVGLDELKLALLAVVVNPKIGGLLIRGPKGSGKSTAVRALEDLLPEVEVVEGCRFGCDPRSPNLCWECRERMERGESPLPTRRKRMRIVTLPLSATEDRVVGSLDVEATLREGRVRFRPGVLAEANRNILYVDEINLLPDFLVDDLLDVAASGINVVEREGVSVEHPSEFILIGSMNPEEGEMRPQLLDRLALSVTVAGSYSPEERAEIVRRNAEFRADPVGFYERYREEQERIRERIRRAREILPEVRVPEEVIRGIALLCHRLRVDGVRPDIAIYETSRALAAIDGRREVDWEHIRLAAKLALSHRTRAGGTLEPATEVEIEEALSEATRAEVRAGKVRGSKPRREGELERKREGRGIRLPAVPVSVPFFLALLAALSLAFASLFPGASLAQRLILLGWSALALAIYRYLLSRTRFELAKPGVVSALLRPFLGPVVTGFGPEESVEVAPTMGRIALPILEVEEVGRSARGGRTKTDPEVKRGRVRGWRIPRGRPASIHVTASIVSAVSAGAAPVEEVLRVRIRPEDVREKLYERNVPLTAIIVLDLSDSMTLVRIEFARALSRLYRELSSRRDRIGVVALRDMDAFVVHPPTTNVAKVARLLGKLSVSGLTPLASGLMLALALARAERLRDPDSDPLVIILTDGYPNVPLPVNPLTGRRGRREHAVSNVQRHQAIEDVAAAAQLMAREGLKVAVINPDPVASAHRITPQGAGLLYRLSLSEDGWFDAERFVKLASRRYDPFAVGSAVSALIAHLTTGEYYTASSPEEVASTLESMLGES